MGDGEQRIEFTGLVDADERRQCLDLVCDDLLPRDERRIRGLSFASCHLTADDVRRLAKALCVGSGPQIAALGISKNPGVAADAWKELLDAMPPKLLWLDLGDNELSDGDLAPLFAALPGREDLDKLYLDGNRLHEISSLCEAVLDTGVTNLDLGDNNIDDAGAQCLAKMLPKSVLMILVLGTNPLGADGAGAIFQALPRCSLDVLYLDNTGTNDACLKFLGCVLKDSKLTELHIDSTRITDDGVKNLIPSIAGSEISYLDVSENGIGEDTVKLLGEALAVTQGRVETEET